MTNHTLGVAFNDVIESVVVLNDTAYLVLKDGRQVGLIGKPVTYAVPQPTKPSIDWREVNSEWKWLATDQSGRSYLHKDKPIPFFPLAWWTSQQQVDACVFSSYVAGTCEWYESLVERPDGV